jgi:hypothetical protein
MKIKFELEFSGLQTVKIDADGEMLRPPTAPEIARALAAEIESKFQNAGQKGLKINVKQIK